MSFDDMNYTLICVGFGRRGIKGCEGKLEVVLSRKPMIAPRTAFENV
jgi:hypothetical protein